MRADLPTYVIPGKTRHSLGQMIRDEETRKTIRILNPEGPTRRQPSFVERYRGMDYASRPMPRDRS